MADKKISQLTPATLPLAGTELLPIVQSGTTDNITVNNLAAGNIKSNATTGVLQVSGPAAATTRVMTVPNDNFTVARTDAANTFSGAQTFSSDATISTHTIGKGTGTLANNLAVGRLALSGANSGVGENTAIGIQALQTNTTGKRNVAVGGGALLTSNSDNNVAVGTSALEIATGASNVAIGKESGALITTGASNSILGGYKGGVAPISATGSNYAVISDGVGNVKAYGDASNNWNVPTGNLVIGTSGKGIDFSATASGSGTMTSELLADYEEGTGTITLTPGTSGSITINPSYDTYAYTKIGRQVTVTGFFLIAGVSSPVGTYVDLALPYAVADLTESAGKTTGLAQFYTGGTSSFRQVNVLEGTSVMRIYVTAASIAAADDCTFSVTYFTS